MLLPHDYLNYYLTGTFSMECGDASGTALLDVRRRVWSEATMAAIDPRLAEWLPPLGAAAGEAGTLLADRARRFGFSTEVVVSAGGGDNMMGAIGTGNVAAGIVTASFGTSGTIYASAAKPVVDPQGEIAAFCSSTGGWLPLLCTMNVTAVTERVRGLFNFDHAALDAAVAATPAGADGLVLLPYLAGSAPPTLPDASGVLLGLSHRTLAPAHLARATMEGVTLGMNYGLRRLAALGVKAREIRVTGGGARSPVWRQIMADIFGVPVVAMVEAEGAALGAALQAAWCAARRDGRPNARITDFTSELVAPDEATRCRPNRALAGRYRELQELHDRLSFSLREIFPAQRKLAEGR